MAEVAVHDRALSKKLDANTPEGVVTVPWIVTTVPSGPNPNTPEAGAHHPGRVKRRACRPGHARGDRRGQCRVGR